MSGEARYLIVGDGRAATHMRHYLALLGLPATQWSRRMAVSGDAPETLEAALGGHSHVLLLIADGALQAFVDAHPALEAVTVVHFAGGQRVRGACGAHPLMTFGPALYDEAQYRRIPFVVTDEDGPFEQLLPGLPNRHYRIDAADRGLYHALCVTAGNFTTLLWSKFFADLEGRLGLPAEVGVPYMEQVVANTAGAKELALTGPIARGDVATIARNLRALEGDELHTVYRAFVEAFAPELLERVDAASDD